MKDRIITFILMIIILGILGVIGYTGYMVYAEISKEGTIEINFESETGFPTIEFIPDTQETIDAIINGDMFSGIDGSTLTVKKSRHLYNQLDITAKTIYNQLYENKENLKTGTYRIDFGNSFYSVLSKEGGDEELKRQYQSAIESLIYENPDIFYLDVTRMSINIEKITKITGVKYNVFIDNGNDFSYLADGFYSKQDVEKYEAQIKDVKNRIVANLQGKSDYEKIKVVHDYLVDTIEYESTLSQYTIYDIYGALVMKKSVCEGYAKAFQYIMNELGIENAIVIGKGTNSRNQTENHAWNYVKLNGNWYAVDSTWDDPIIIGGGTLSNTSRYRYFLKGSNTMSQNHFPSGKFTEQGQEFQYPQLSVEDYK